jgi:hypothetical protein
MTERLSSTPGTLALGRLSDELYRLWNQPAASLLPSADGSRCPEQLETSLSARADAMSLEASFDPSPLPAGATSPAAALDGVSLGAVMTPSPGDGGDVAPVPERCCGWCRSPLEVTRFRWCSTLCRQTAWRARQIEAVEDPNDTPKLIRIADPPYLNCARRYYQHEESYAGEVDHEALIAESERDFDGWALACSTKSLRVLLPLCPPDVRVGIWAKPHGASPQTRGIHAVTEAVIVKPARLRKPGVVDFLYTSAARGGGKLPGRKPLKWCLWVFRLLGASPMDALDDPFPGTGMITKAFGQFKTKRAAGSLRGANV